MVIWVTVYPRSLAIVITQLRVIPHRILLARGGVNSSYLCDEKDILTTALAHKALAIEHDALAKAVIMRFIAMAWLLTYCPPIFAMGLAAPEPLRRQLLT